VVSRQVVEGVQRQGVDEKVFYKITTTNWGSSPTNPSMKVFDEDDTDVTDTVAPSGSIGVSGDVLTLKRIEALTEGIRYTVEVQFTVSGSGEPFECYFYIDAEE
jgi:hypothetical protein